MSNQNTEDVPKGDFEPAPEITSEMIQTTHRALEAEGLIHYMKGGAYVPTESGWKKLRESEPISEEIIAYGHEKIVAKDDGSFKIIVAKDPKGEDNVIAVGANKGCKDLRPDFKAALKHAGRIEIAIEAENVDEKIFAHTSPALKLTDKDEIVIRKSDLIDGKTIAILANKAASDFGKVFKDVLKNPETKVKIILEVKG